MGGFLVTVFGRLSCKACGTYVVPNAKSCPGCGRKRRSAKRALALIVVAEFAALGGGMYWWSRPRANTPGLQRLALADATISDMATRGGWTLYTTRDGAVNDLTRHARLIANAGAERDSPESKATLELRNSATYGKAVIITFPTVAAACPTRRCAVTAVFDNQTVQPYDIIIDTESPTTTVQLSDFNSFLQHLTRAHDLALTFSLGAASLGTAKDVVLRFTVTGFAWA